MDIRRLQYFVAVAEEMNFSRAADRLFITQPGLSQQVRRLERELGATLFDRTTRNVALTDAGHVLLADARSVLNGIAAAKANVQRTVAGETGSLRVGFVSSSALTVVPLFVQRLKAQWPNVHIVLTEMTTERQLEALRSGELDIGLVREMEPTDELTSAALSTERLHIAIPSGHPIAAKESVLLEDLADQEFVVFPRDAAPKLFDHIDLLCTQAGFKLQIAQEALQFSTILGLVASGAGIGIVPESLLSLRLAGLTYLPIEDEGARSVLSITCRTTGLETQLLKNAFDAARGLITIDSDAEIVDLRSAMSEAP